MVNVPISNGELIDKLSILHIKKNRISNPEKLEFINKEFELLYNMSSYYLNDEVISKLYHQLVNVNSKLWDIEDELRILESEKKWDSQEFINLSRKVYHTNDERFSIKNEINDLTNSEIKEQKNYVEYK